MQHAIDTQGLEVGLFPGLSARERNKLKRDLKRKGSSILQSQASLSQAKRGKTSADASVQQVTSCKFYESNRSKVAANNKNKMTL